MIAPDTARSVRSTGTLSTSEIKHRSIDGAKWLVMMNGIGMPAAFLISMLLGRIGPQALGAYAMVQILIAVITTFVVYGGSPVLSVFLPKLSTSGDRGRFVFSYLLILLLFMAAVLCFFWGFPGVLEFLLQREFYMRNYGWFVLLALAIAATETFANAASGLMLIKISALARQVMRLVLLPLVFALFLFRRDLLLAHTLPILLGGFLAGYMVAAMISLVGICLDKRFSLRPGWLIPQGFWAFSAATMASTIFAFFYGNFDRIAVLSIQDLEGLGKYQAVLTINAFIEHIPGLVVPALTPTFSNLLVAGYQKTFQTAFSLLCRWAVLPVTVIALVTMGFSHTLLSLFGRNYADYAWLLTLFGLVAIIRSLNIATSTINTCMEHNAFRFIQQLSMVSVQCILTFALATRYGVVAIAGAKMISVAIASLSGVLYVFVIMGMSPRLPRAYKSAVLVGSATTILQMVMKPTEWIWESLLTLSSLMVFVMASHFTWREGHDLIRFLLGRDTAILTKMSNKPT